MRLAFFLFLIFICVKLPTYIMDKKTEKIIDKVITNEGGYNNDHEDLGGETKYGISKRWYPHLNIPYLTLEDAKQIYYDDYYKPAKVHKLPYELQYPFFDCVINTGQKRATKILQEAINMQSVIPIEVDGKIGPKTLKAAQGLTAKRFVAYRVKFYGKLIDAKPEQEKFYYGWFKRSLETLDG